MPQEYTTSGPSASSLSISSDPPRIVVIGAGSRGNAYARATCNSSNGKIVAVAEPVEVKRRLFGQKFIWGDENPREGQMFEDWKDFIRWEYDRREKALRGESVPRAADGVFVCTMDETHAEIVTALAPLGLHILCEKPLATTLDDCLDIYKTLLPGEGSTCPPAIFAVGHVLRYSPHNMLLRKLLLEDDVIGDIVSIEHTEPVSRWQTKSLMKRIHRGNWRKESRTAPSLLTKSCHDIDLLLWLLCSPSGESEEAPHLPSTVSSTGSLVYFRQASKPKLAGSATNCLSCPAESVCMYSAKKIYLNRLRNGVTGWPVKIVVPDIEDCIRDGGFQAAEDVLMSRLAEDYDQSTPRDERDGRPWFGRCVYEAGNDVCDDQFVTLTWEDDSRLHDDMGEKQVEPQCRRRNAKHASFHMVAFTERICERRSRVYGTKGEIEADSKTIRVYDFESASTDVYHPHLPGGGHGGGDDGLTRQFLLAVDAVKNRGSSVARAQRDHIGCTLEGIIRSHAMVFAAEDARRQNRIVDWREWWKTQVENRL
ncbi:MAG: hypothetical protein M1816_003559 [Peltula sp. TS41687]|nr:MAG: hypothetical protein M1816_003559 [Peltula sp. TS41687]